MRSVIISLACLLTAGLAWGQGDKAATGWSVANVSVSTTSVTALPTTALVGRYKILIQNTNSTFDLYVGTSSALAASTGFVVLKGSSTLELPTPQGLSIFGLGAANATVGSLDVRIIEFK